MPKANNSSGSVTKHNHVNADDLILKSTPCSAIERMLESSSETTVTGFYCREEKTIGAAKAQIAAARKLTCVVWAILTPCQPYIEESEESVARKMASMNRSSKKSVAFSE